jgi:nucleoside-diphosphate-sugar epimerase
MKILIIGAAGMIGAKLAASFANDPEPGLTEMTLVDVIEPKAPEAPFPVRTATLDITDAEAVDKALDPRPDVIFHLSAIVSGEAELDFDKGYDVNFRGMLNILEAIRARKDYHPKLIFASSIAVYGAPFPDTIPDEFFLTPLTSYGTQKAMGELLLADYSRKGIIDGIGIRLPTICIRPGAPNKAASGFFSNILREPLVGKEAILPVSEEVRHWHASPRSAIGFFRHALRLDTDKVGPRRSMAMPGLSATVGEQIEALRRAAGDEAVALIKRVPDPMIIRIVDGWATRFDPSRALALGFTADASFDDIIAAHVEDELGGKIGGERHGA